MQADFDKLYSMLDLTPECTLAEFDRAYRRAVSTLHPDRHSKARSVEQQARLRDLISLHAQALQFHRRHGRLPGAAAVAGAVLPSPVFVNRPVPPTAAVQAQTRGGLRRWLVFVPVVAFVVWQLSANPESRLDLAGADASGSWQQVAVPQPGYLSVGMEPRLVLAIQGSPESRDGDTWHYGASWVRFEEQRLVDWYSSPFQRLRTSSARPEAR